MERFATSGYKERPASTNRDPCNMPDLSFFFSHFFVVRCSYVAAIVPLLCFHSLQTVCGTFFAPSSGIHILPPHAHVYGEGIFSRRRSWVLSSDLRNCGKHVLRAHMPSECMVFLGDSVCMALSPLWSMCAAIFSP